MVDEVLQKLISTYDAATWLTPEERIVNVFVHKLAPSDAPIADGEPALVQQIDIEPQQEHGHPEYTRALRESSPTPQRSPLRVTFATWQVYATGKPLYVDVRTIECDSRDAARKELLIHLAQIQGPALVRSDVAGEISFASPGNTIIAGVRGNFVWIVLNNSANVDLSPYARGLDEQLMRIPDEQQEISAAPPLTTALGEQLALPIDDDDDDESYRVIAHGGEVRIEYGRPAFVPNERGEHDLVVSRRQRVIRHKLNVK